MSTVNDQITTALRELGIVGLVDTPESDLSTLALTLYNRILDEWNATRRAIYADVHSSLLAFTAGTNPHTIGPAASSPTWSTGTSHRPVSIEGIRITADDGDTYQALTPRSAEWWHSLTAPSTASDYPTDFYYNPAYPLGAIYFSPEPSSASIKAQLWYRTVLSSVALADTFTMPPGYDAAMVETLKEKLTGLPMFASAANGDIAAAARKARALAFGNNDRVPALVTDLEPGPAVYRVETGPFGLLRR